MTIDYAKMQREFPKQKASLTRAKKKGYHAVVFSTLDTVRQWNETGAWPDSWHDWQRAIDDAYNADRARYAKGEIDAMPRHINMEEL